MKYLKLFKNESDFSIYKEGDEYIVPNICYMKEINKVSIEPLKPKRIATFNVTQSANTVLFANTSVISSIKVNGELDTNFIPFKIVDINQTNLEIYDKIKLGVDAFVKQEDNTYKFNEAYYNSLLNLSNFYGEYYNITFKEKVNPENINVIMCLSLGVTQEIMESNFSEPGFFSYNEEKNTIFIPDEMIQELTLLISSYGLNLKFLFYDKTNPYNEYTIQTKGAIGSKIYAVNDLGTYEVEVNFSTKELPKDLFLSSYYLDLDDKYLVESPLVSINKDFFNECTSIPTFKGCGELSSHVVIPSSVQKLPGMEIINLNGESMLGEPCGLFMGCRNLPSYEFGKTFEVNELQFYNMFKGCQNLKSIDFSKLKVKDITDLSSAFQECTSLTSIDFSNIDTSNVTTMYHVFENCINLTTVVMMHDVSKVTNFYNMFYNINTNGVFIYNPIYDYSKIISVLPATWTAIPFEAKNIGCIELSLSHSDTIHPYIKKEEINYVATITGNSLTDNSIISTTISGVGKSNFEQVVSINGKNYSRMSFTLLNKTAYIDIEQNDNYCICGKYKQGIADYIFNRNQKDKIEKIYIGNKWVEPSSVANSYLSPSEVIFKIKDSVTDLSYLFAQVSHLKYVEMGDFGQNITNIESMFNGCRNLEELNVSNFDTSNVTSMEFLFTACKLKELNVSNWDTSNVINMRSMFHGCTELNKLDLSGWDTKKVINMYSMFYGCTELNKLDLSSWDTSNVTDMACMFYDCKKLEELDISNWDTSNVNNIVSIFYGCNSLKDVNVSNWKTSNFNSMGYMFYNCYSLNSIDLSNWDFSHVVTLSHMFENCYTLKKLDLSNIIFNKNANPYQFIYNSGINEIIINTDFNYGMVDEHDFYTLSNFGVFYYNPEYDCSIIQNKLRTGWSCVPILETKQIVDLKIIGNTSNVSGNATRAQVTYEATYSGTIANSESAITYTITGKTYSNDFEQNLSTSESREINIEINVDGMIVTDTIVQEPYDYNLIYARYNSKYSNVFYMEALDKISEIYVNDVQIDPIPYIIFDNEPYDIKLRINDNVTSLGTLFRECSNLETVDFSRVNTSNINDMNRLFGACSELTSVNLTDLNTSNVADMSYMFYECGKLIELDVSNFDTSNVSNMKCMFSGCGKIKELDVSNFDTSNVTDMSYVFYSGMSLENIDVSNWDTSNVTDMRSMFYECNKLKEIDVSNWDTSNVTDMRWVFYRCKSLESVDVSNWDTSNVTNMRSMFNECEDLTSLDVSNWDTSNVTDMSYMFLECSKLTTLDLSNFDTSNVTDMSFMFYYCDGLTALDLSNFDTSNVTDMSYMFFYCWYLKTLDLSNFDTSNVTDMTQMFYNCYALTEIKMGGQVKSSCKLDYMFGGTGNYSNNCIFYYNSAYDYSRVLAKLPSNWSKVPY